MSKTPRHKKQPDYGDTLFPAAAQLWEAARNGYRTNREINAWLELFSPNSAGAVRARADCTLISARDTVPLLCDLLSSLSHAPAPPKPIQSVCTERNARVAADELARIFAARGSDKADDHDYHLLYGALLADIRQEPVSVLEIGLGTNNTDVVSNMGAKGSPGASLRAFRDFLPRGEILGADVDRRILFSEERIVTFHVDQTKPDSFRSLDAQLAGKMFDLVIDDGLHSPNANICTLTFALRKLKPGGHAVIEDIHERSLPIWTLVGMILPPQYDASILSAKNGHLFVIRNTAD